LLKDSFEMALSLYFAPLEVLILSLLESRL